MPPDVPAHHDPNGPLAPDRRRVALGGPRLAWLVARRGASDWRPGVTVGMMSPMGGSAGYRGPGGQAPNTRVGMACIGAAVMVLILGIGWLSHQDDAVQGELGLESTPLRVTTPDGEVIEIPAAEAAEAVSLVTGEGPPDVTATTGDDALEPAAATGPAAGNLDPAAGIPRPGTTPPSGGGGGTTTTTAPTTTTTTASTTTTTASTTTTTASTTTTTEPTTTTTESTTTTTVGP